MNEFQESLLTIGFAAVAMTAILSPVMLIVWRILKNQEEWSKTQAEIVKEAVRELGKSQPILNAAEYAGQFVPVATTDLIEAGLDAVQPFANLSPTDLDNIALDMGRKILEALQSGHDEEHTTVIIEDAENVNITPPPVDETPEA